MDHRAGDEFGAPAGERSAWLIPLAVFVVTAALTAAFLAYYLFGSRLLGPEPPAPRDSAQIVALSVGGIGFHIPANYIVFASQRQGGPQESLDLVALLPDMQGYTLAAAEKFSSDQPDSPVLNLSMAADRVAITDAEKLERIYMPYVTNPEGTTGPFGLTEYGFGTGSGYSDEVLFVGASPNGPILFLCVQPSAGNPAPTCQGTVPLGSGLSLTYRFKRLHLERWNDISTGVRALIGAFTDKT